MSSSQAFFVLVERHLTPAMLKARYVKIGEYDQMRPPPTSGLLSSGRVGPRTSRVLSWRRKTRRAQRAASLEVGYEGSLDGDEEWILYDPETRELDLTSWRETLEGHADWDVWHDRLVPDDQELERRLMVLGEAVRARGE